jgi:hypothetical protein
MMIGCDYISELWPPTGLFFIPQVIYEHGDPWRNDDIDRENFRLVYQNSLAFLPAEASSSKGGRNYKENDKVDPTKYLCSYFIGFFNMP